MRERWNDDSKQGQREKGMTRWLEEEGRVG